MYQKYQNTQKKKLLINAQNFRDGREMIIDAFKNKIFPMVSTGFEWDVDEEEVLKRHGDKINILPSKKNELPTTAGDLDKMYTCNVDDLDKLLLDTEKYLDPDLAENILDINKLLNILDLKSEESATER